MNDLGKLLNTGIQEFGILVLFLLKSNKEFTKQRPGTQFSEKIQKSKNPTTIMSINLSLLHVEYDKILIYKLVLNLIFP